MPVLYQMIGVPGVGKSTFIKNHPILSILPVISTDIHVEEYARKCNKTYSEVFNEFMPKAVKLMMDDVGLVRERQLDGVWDQTSTTILSRRKKFNALPTYNHIAVWIKTPPEEVLIKRLGQRKGKTIPMDVVNDMIINFDVPTLEEGFDEVWEVEYNGQVIVYNGQLT